MISSPRTDRRFRLSEEQARSLAAAYGTPLYVVDERHFRERIREYRDAFLEAYPKASITYASKANSTVALIAIAHQEGCDIDVASEGELRAALAAGVPAASCHFHGNNKQRSELEFAVSNGVGYIVADHFGELETIADIVGGRAPGSPRIVLRLAPGVDPVTHAKISTGQADTKFGFNIADGSAEKATRRALDLGLDLHGFHCHVGSQLLDPEAQRSGGELIARFAIEMNARHGYAARYLNVGGGLGVMYTEGDQPMAIREYNRMIVDAVLGALEGSGIEPTLGQEPGRSLIGESGVTLYTVGVVKTVPARAHGTRTYVAVDGGLSDNPRPVMYGAAYTVERIGSSRDEQWQTVTVSGKHCETDRLFPDVELPGDIGPGDLLQVLVTGAYNSAMASNYNRYPRPATALLRTDGSHCLIQRRESWDDVLAREQMPSDLRR
ncbi:MAG TPA: diaminopimelate decarboxylase [Fimbriimonas sp.]